MGTATTNLPHGFSFHLAQLQGRSAQVSVLAKLVHSLAILYVQQCKCSDCTLASSEFCGVCNRDLQPGENIALGKPTSQSHVDHGGISARGVDGGTIGIYTDGRTCTHTQFGFPDDEPSWWQVDLGEIYSVSNISIYHRTDGLRDRLTGARVTVSHTADYTASDAVGCYMVNENGFMPQPEVGSCGGLFGRYITVWKPTLGYLTICEFEATAVNYVTLPCPCACASCIAGMYDHDSNSATPCTPCAAGKFSDAVDAEECVGTCVVGQYAPPQSISPAACQSCPAGQADDDSDPSTPCSPCEPGLYSASVGTTACADRCEEPGTEAPSGSVSCLLCHPGFFDDDNSSATACAPCQPGRFSVTEGAWHCEGTCPNGTFSAEGSQLCAGCVPGMYDDDNDPATACQDCPGGRFSYAHGSTECSLCTVTIGGQGLAGATSDACEQCSPGRTDEDSDPSTVCSDCRAGQYSSAAGQIGMCGGVCPSGRFAPAASDSQSDCSICVPGQYDDDEDPGTPCINCAPGFVSTMPEATVCSACSAGQSTAEADYFLHPDGVECGACTIEFSAACEDSPVGWVDTEGDTCEDWGRSGWCSHHGDDYFDMNGVSANEACCVCGRAQNLQERTLALTGGIDVSLTGGLVTEGKQTQQSSEGYDGASERGVDGLTDGNWFGNTCTHTQFASDDGKEWWQVDLANMYSVSNITIFHRTDCCHDRLQDAHVYLSATDDYTFESHECHVVASGGGETQPEVGTCSGQVGRYLTVDLFDDFLTICEFQAWGQPHAAKQNTTCRCACVECTPGMYDDDADPATACVKCPAGQYSSLFGATTCAGVCPAGTYALPGSDSLVACALCEPGSYDHDLSAGTPCKYCTVGFFAELPGMITCTGPHCQPGFYSADPVMWTVGATVRPTLPCMPCPYGKIDVDGDPATPCSFCNVGRAWDPNTAAGVVNATSLCRSVCQPGSYSIPGAAIDDPCEPCAPGRYDADGDPSTPCVDCIGGRYSNAVGSVECEGLCHVGTYALPGSTNCSACAPGQYDHDANMQTPCALCPSGRFSYAAGAIIECAGLCPAGTFSEPGATSTASCSSCIPGWHDNDNTSVTECTTCAAGRFSSAPAAQYCPLCSPGKSTTLLDYSRWIESALEPRIECDMDCSLRWDEYEAEGGPESGLGHQGSSVAGSVRVPCRCDCVPCLPGRFDDDNDPSTSCTLCPAGRFESNAGQIECAGECSPGMYSPPGLVGPADMACHACAPGTTDDDRDSSSPCLECDAGRFASVYGTVGPCPGVCAAPFGARPGAVNCIMMGCTDPLAPNFNASAELDDASCSYDCSSLNSAGEQYDRCYIHPGDQPHSQSTLSSSADLFAEQCFAHSQSNDWISIPSDANCNQGAQSGWGAHRRCEPYHYDRMFGTVDECIMRCCTAISSAGANCRGFFRPRDAGIRDDCLFWTDNENPDRVYNYRLRAVHFRDRKHFDPVWQSYSVEPSFRSTTWHSANMQQRRSDGEAANMKGSSVIVEGHQRGSVNGTNANEIVPMITYDDVTLRHVEVRDLGTHREQEAPAMPDCVDDPEGQLAGAGMDCSHILPFGCDTDMQSVNPALPQGRNVSSICPESCDACPAAPAPAPAASAGCRARLYLGVRCDCQEDESAICGATAWGDVSFLRDEFDQTCVGDGCRLGAGYARRCCGKADIEITESPSGDWHDVPEGLHFIRIDSGCSVQVASGYSGSGDLHVHHSSFSTMTLDAGGNCVDGGTMIRSIRTFRDTRGPAVHALRIAVDSSLFEGNMNDLDYSSALWTQEFHWLGSAIDDITQFSTSFNGGAFYAPNDNGDWCDHVERSTYEQDPELGATFGDTVTDYSHVEHACSKMALLGVFCLSCQPRISILSSTFRHNSAIRGVVHAASVPTQTTQIFIRNSQFQHNSAQKGAAVHTGLRSNVTVLGSHFEQNSAIFGGAIYLGANSMVRIVDSKFIGNSAFAGGGIYAGAGANVVVISSLFQNNNRMPDPGTISSGDLAMPEWDVLLRDLLAGAYSSLPEDSAAHVHVTQPDDVYILDTSFIPFEPTNSAGESVYIGGSSTLGDCERHPCEPGFQCLYRQYSLSCSECPDQQISAEGIACASCSPGRGRISDPGTECAVCPGNTISQFGVCQPCPPGTSADATHLSCESVINSEYEAADAQIVLQAYGDMKQDGRSTMVISSNLLIDTNQNDPLTFLSLALNLSATDVTIVTWGQHRRVQEEVVPSHVEFLITAVDSDIRYETAILDAARIFRENITFRFVCPPGMLLDMLGLGCNKCPYPEYLDSEKGQCIKCLPMQEPNEVGDGCNCKAGTYDTSKGKITCQALGSPFRQTNVPCTDDEPDQCDMCYPCDMLSDCIVSCDGSRVELVAGYAMLSHGETNSVLECRAGPDACPTVNATIGYTTTCAQGYVGPLCGACEEHWKIDSDGMCSNCSEASWWIFPIFLVVFGLLVCAIWNLKYWFGSFTTMRECVEIIREMQLSVLLKILLVTTQIASGLGSVLQISFPSNFKTFLQALATLVQFDWYVFVGIGCVLHGNYVPSLLMNCIVIVIITTVVTSAFCFQMVQVNQKDYTIPNEYLPSLRELLSKLEADGVTSLGNTASETRAIVLTYADSVAIPDAVIEVLSVLHQIFKKVDIDGDGISASEMQTIIEKVDKNVTKELIEDFFEQLDSSEKDASTRDSGDAPITPRDTEVSLARQIFGSIYSENVKHAVRLSDSSLGALYLAKRFLRAAECLPIIQDMDSEATIDSIDFVFDRVAALEKELKDDRRIDFIEFVSAAQSDAMSVESCTETATMPLAELVRKVQRADYKAAAIGRLFLVMFLFYPTFTNKIFEGFACRDLGPIDGLQFHKRVLEADYTVDCNSVDYAILFTFCCFLVILWPIGLPCVLGWALTNHRKLIAQGDPDSLKLFSFIIGDYKPEHWYWELIELFRRLLLCGLLGLLARGSVAQSVIGCVISVAFFALTCRARPYKKTSLNTVKIYADFVVVVVTLLSIVLQAFETDFQAEAITPDMYGNVLLAVNLALVPVVVYYICVMKAETKSMLEDVRHDLGVEDEEWVSCENPLLENSDV